MMIKSLLNPTDKSMQTDPTEETGVTLVLLVMAGLPKHGTRWARAQNPTPRELNLEERSLHSEVKC
jgi:hypothetical protein